MAVGQKVTFVSVVTLFVRSVACFADVAWIARMVFGEVGMVCAW